MVSLAPTSNLISVHLLFFIKWGFRGRKRQPTIKKTENWKLQIYFLVFKHKSMNFMSKYAQQ